MSTFVVSARKYRPSSFDEVLGQEQVTNTLKNAIQNDQLAHAFLFTGPRGVGKTSTARILAKVLNCEDRKEKGTVACGICNSCKAMEDTASFNIIELDAASNNTVDHMRMLNEQVRFRPQEGQYKIFIIDEVHMLSNASFNAFLKTLEEPPEYAIFILATTEKHKILPTILSRCQLFDFRRIPISEIVKQLELIAKKEKIKIDEDAMHLIAQKSDGAMRDSLSIFDKITSTFKGEIGYKEVATSLNLLDYDYFFKAIDSLVQEDLTGIYLLYDEIVRNGFDAEAFIQGLTAHVRDILMTKSPETLELIQTSDEQKKRYKDQSKLCSQSFLISSLELLTQTGINLPRANNQHLMVEVALAKMAYINRQIEEGSDQKKNSISQVLA